MASCCHPTRRLCRCLPFTETALLGLPLAHRALPIRLLRRRSQRKERLRSLHVHCSLRSLRLTLVCRCLPHSLAGERRACSFARPGQRRVSLAQHGGRAIPDARSISSRSCNVSSPRDAREKRQLDYRRDRCCRAAQPPLSEVADAASAAGGSDQRRRGARHDLAGVDSAAALPAGGCGARASLPN